MPKADTLLDQKVPDNQVVEELLAGAPTYRS